MQQMHVFFLHLFITGESKLVENFGNKTNSQFPHNKTTRRYGPLCGPTSSSCGGLRPLAEAFFGQKKELIMLFWPIFGNFWCPVVTLVTFSSNISNNTKKTKKSKKIQKI